jgi:hypothetical protein
MHDNSPIAKVTRARRRAQPVVQSQLKHHMRTFFQKAFVDDSNLRGAGYRYGMLAIILALILVGVFLPSLDYFSRMVCPLMLLFNHLAFQFHWPRPVAIALRAFASFWIVFGAIYLLCQVNVHR